MGVKIKKEELILRLENIFGKDVYNYDLVDYKGAHIDIKIKCNTCNNIFEKSPSTLYRGWGCLLCGHKPKSQSKFDTEYFIIRANKVHNSKYDYSKVNYINNSTKLVIICKTHGEFTIHANSHLQGRGCEQCGFISSVDTRSRLRNEKKYMNIIQPNDHKIIMLSQDKVAKVDNDDYLKIKSANWCFNGR